MPTSNRNSDLRPSLGTGPRAAAESVNPPARTEASHAPVAVTSTDLQGKLTGCNLSFAELLGYTPQELVGRDLSALFSPEQDAPKSRQQRWQEAILGHISSQGHYQAHLSAHPKSSDVFSVEFTATLLRNAGAPPAGIVIFVSRTAKSSSSNIVSGTSRPSGARYSCRTIDGTQFILASPVMEEFMAMVDRVASHTETALVTGETGTGKELIARTVHESSQRRSRPWVDINCAALPENLVESELFGFEKGAFSGADSSKPGLFEMADKGTLFLDEIGELQLQTQVKLLRVLDGQPFYRLGGHRKIKVDVRIVAATNQDLEAAVSEGRFRKDLFHRLGQFQLRVPPLRERPEDIVALAEHFLRLKAPGKHFTPEAISALLSHAWPGNIRELRNLVAKVAMETPSDEITVSRLQAVLSNAPAALRQTASMPVGNLDSMEEQMIIKALERTGGHRAMAAEQLGISRRTLSRKLKEYNLNSSPGENAAPFNFISTEQQKFFRARVELPVTIRNAQGYEAKVRGVNLSTGGMGLDSLAEPLRFAGLLDVSFMLPETDEPFQAKARLMWVGEEGRVGIRFVVIEPALFEQLQHWTNKKMKEEGWDFPA